MTFCCCWGACLSYCDPPPFLILGCEERYNDEDVRASPRVRRSQSVGSLSSTLTIVSYEWAKDNILKYKSFLTSTVSVVALQCQVKLVNPEDSCKLVV